MSNIENIVGPLQSHGLEKEFINNQYYKIISKMQEYIHKKIPEENFNTSVVAAPTDYRKEVFNGVNYSRAVIYLLTNGCEWALKSGHGCTMCGHLGKQARKTQSIVPDDLINQFNGEFSKIDFREAPLLNLYNNGSFLNHREIPPAARVKILRKINAEPHIKMVVIESRPEFITEENVKEVKELLSNKYVEIAIGLELKNDFYRNLCLNKGFSGKIYSNAASIITRYLHLRSYVFLKPPFLTERESIDEAVETIDYAFDRGNTTVSLEACTIQDYTLVQYLKEYGLYTTPWMWSIIEVVKRASRPRNKKLIVGLFQFYPSPCVIPYNCPQCSEKVMDAIRQYNSTLDVAVFDGLSCHCQEEWRNILTQKSEPFEKRLEVAISQLRKGIGV